MRRLLLPLLLAAMPAAAQPDWRSARDVELRLAPNDITPGEVRLKAGEPARLRIINGTLGAYRLSAPELLSVATMRRRDRAALSGGLVIQPGAVRELVINAPPGRYAIASTSIVRRLLGMRAEIIVE